MRILAAGLLFASGVPAVVAGLPPQWKHWSHSREIGLGPRAAAGLVRVEVPEELFARARTDLADLRVIDGRGAEVGYVLFARGQGPETAWRPAALSDAGFVAGRFSQVIADTGEGANLHNAVEVTLPYGDEEFFCWVEVAASEDRASWRIVRDRAPLYRFRDKGFAGPVTIRYPRTRDRWLRLRLLEGAREVEISRLRVGERAEEEEELVPIGRRPALRPDSPRGESRWEPEGELAPVPVAAVRVRTAREDFHRPLTASVSDDGERWRQVGSGQVYRIRSRPGTVRQSLQVELRESSAPFWRVAILDGGDPPIDDLEVLLMHNPRQVVFRSEAGGSYRLIYGNQRAKAPAYEIAQLTSRDQQATARPASLGPERANDAWVSSEPFTERHPLILWVALAVAVAVLGWMALRALR